MTRSRQWPLVLAFLAFSLLLCTGLAGAETRMVPKVDNFILFTDYSGSMSMVSDKTGERKMASEKQFLLQLNEAIPKLGYQAALVTFAPFEQLSPPVGVASYDKAAFRTSITGLETEYELFGRTTPMGDGLTAMDSSIGLMSKRLAVVILSDGESNIGVDPVPVARAYYDKYPGNICFHVVSFADNARDQKTLDNIAALSTCTVQVDGDTLLTDQAAFDTFVRDVFYDEREVAAAPAKAVAPPKPKAKAMMPVKVEPVEEILVLRSINFNLNRADVRPDMEPVLEEAVEIIKSSNRRVQLDGHTCNLGTEDYNMKLSERRARAIKAYMVSKGIEPMSVSTMGYGESRPNFDNTKEESRKLNRRVELSFK